MSSAAERKNVVQSLRFSGQSALSAWSIREHIEQNGWSAYDHWLSQELVLTFQSLRALAEAFPTWQHRVGPGRPPIDERTHLIAMFLRQYLRASFRKVESFLRMAKGFFGIEHVPDHNTMSKMNRSRRFTILLRRFHQFLLEPLPARDVIVATDATGFSNRIQQWRTTDHGLRAWEGDWLKLHAAVDVPSLLFLSMVVTRSNVHESRRFEDVWMALPDNIHPVRSLADAAYTGERCLQVARDHGANAHHAITSNAVHVAQPQTLYQGLVNFPLHWPNRSKALRGPRALVETAFSCLKTRFGHRLGCRKKRGRTNEVLTKTIAHNVSVLTARAFISQAE